MSGEWPETRPASAHETADGDHLSRIAAAYGFRSYEPIWKHAENAGLRSSHRTPHILAPGDRVYIPEVKAHEETNRVTEKRHRFRAAVAPLVLRIQRFEWDGSAKTDAPDAVKLDGKSVPFTSKGNSVELRIEPTSKSATLSRGDVELVIANIGFLHPVNTVSGFRERLNNLGYRAGKSEDATDLDIRSAVEEFQCDNGLTVDGKCGDATQLKLVKVHGC